VKYGLKKEFNFSVKTSKLSSTSSVKFTVRVSAVHSLFTGYHLTQLVRRQN